MSLAPLMKKEENGAEKQFLQEMENHPSGDIFEGGGALCYCCHTMLGGYILYLMNRVQGLLDN